MLCIHDNNRHDVDTGSFFDGARGGKYDTTTNPTPTPAKTYKVPGYGDMTKDEIKKKYDKLRYNDDGTMKSADKLGDASKFGDAANKAVFPNQKRIC